MLPALPFMLFVALAVLASPILLAINGDDLDPWLAQRIRRTWGLIGWSVWPVKVAGAGG